MGSRNKAAGITQNINLGIDKKRSTDTTDIRIRGRGINETLNIGLNSEYVRKDGAIDQITTRSHTQLTDIGTNTHAQIDTAIGTITPLTATTVGSLIAGVDAKATPVDADIVGFSDTQATNLLKKLTWANVKAFLKTYFDTLYNLYTLPTASDSVLGGVKVGSRLSIAAGVLSADVQGGAPTDAHYLTDQAEAGLSAEVVVTANGKSLVTAADYAAMRTLLNVADGANNYTHPSGDGNLHVPANSTTNNGKVLTASAVAGTYTWETPSATVADESITNAKLAHIATSIIKGRVTAGTGDVEDLTAANVRTIINVEDGATKYPDTGEQAFLDADHTKLDGIAAGANAYVHPNHSGDVTSVADGAQTIAAKAVTLAKMADMATASLIYRKTAEAGAPEVNTLATLKTDLALAKADVGLGNCDNTSDANKPVSTAGQTALDLKANLTKVLHCQHQKTAPADCGSSVAGIQTRVLNTVVLNEITGASLASNQITLPAGTYEVYAFCPTYAIGTTQAGIYNTTDSAYTLMGTNGYDITGAFVQGKFTLAAEKVLELRHFTQTARAGNGLGVSANSGMGKEVFANIMITKVA